MICGPKCLQFQKQGTGKVGKLVQFTCIFVAVTITAGLFILSHLDESCAAETQRVEWRALVRKYICIHIYIH